ncbi:4-hydroxy-2-oxoheptanedioate aldolase [Glutamicibacter endophyticus]|uniref:HpcH/HpaI aldolase family protein n=1 Tax=Glutamicibacter sp. PS TaxID=3075634 RepID=UPI00283C3261|nr:HpcH/HpaI aldolase/citrate lyase family protein [Glutamicibacter sp. PS]MDR4533775.1 HpcH/HpaI aldolase/citrate lyase family protein [Glutamicibacter sp. PS]
MSVRVTADRSFKDVLASSDHPLAGVWVCSASTVNAEICAGAGFDWIFLDGEHSPNDLGSLLTQLQAVGGYPTVPVVRPPVNDPVIIKQYLDLGAQSLIIPMVHTAEDAEQAVASCHYPPRGVRGVGSALARSARWNRIDGYLQRAGDTITVIVQIESQQAVDNVEAILATDDLDGVFIGPSDLAATMGLIGQQGHPQVVEAVLKVIAAARAAGKYVGVNAFDPGSAQRYIEAGAQFVGVGADVALLARASEQLAERYRGESDAPITSSY